MIAQKFFFVVANSSDDSRLHSCFASLAFRVIRRFFPRTDKAGPHCPASFSFFSHKYACGHRTWQISGKPTISKFQTRYYSNSTYYLYWHLLDVNFMSFKSLTCVCLGVYYHDGIFRFLFKMDEIHNMFSQNSKLYNCPIGIHSPKKRYILYFVFFFLLWKTPTKKENASTAPFLDSPPSRALAVYVLTCQARLVSGVTTLVESTSLSISRVALQFMQSEYCVIEENDRDFDVACLTAKTIQVLCARERSSFPVSKLFCCRQSDRPTFSSVCAKSLFVGLHHRQIKSFYFCYYNQRWGKKGRPDYEDKIKTNATTASYTWGKIDWRKITGCDAKDNNASFYRPIHGIWGGCCVTATHDPNK